MRLFAPPVADAYATARPAATRYLIFVTPDNQALDTSQQVLPMMPGMPERRTHDYTRHGTTSPFAAFNIADGTVISELHRGHRTTEYLKFLRAIDKAVPAELDVHIVCDNLSTHKTPAVNEWIARPPGSTSTSPRPGLLDQPGLWFAYLTTQLRQRGVHKSAQALEADVRDWIGQRNADPRPFVWKKTGEEILDLLRGARERRRRRRTIRHRAPSVGIQLEAAADQDLRN